MLISYIAVILFVLLSFPLTVLFHELGHALPALLFSKENVTMYVGSYGDTQNSFQIRIGRLNTWVKKGFFWHGGMCEHAEIVPLYQNFIVILGGPLTNLLVGVFGFYIAFSQELPGAWNPFVFIYSFYSIYFTLLTFNSKSKQIQTDDKRQSYSDGYLLKQIIFYKKNFPTISKAIELYNNGEYSDALIYFYILLDKKYNNEQIYKLTVYCLIKTNDYSKAWDIQNIICHKFNLTAGDYINSGFIKNKLGMTGAIEEYKKALHLDRDNYNALNNLGYTLTKSENYEAAIPFFDRAIEIKPQHPFSYNNRGLARIKTGELEAGLKDIKHSMHLDTNNSYVYRNLGIYHLHKNELEEALSQFEKAKEMDAETYQIDELIEETKNQIKI